MPTHDNPIPGLQTAGPDSIEMPAQTTWPMTLALAVTLLAMGIVTNLVVSAVGGVLLIVALVRWVRQLLPGAGHVFEELLPPEQRPRPVQPLPGTVQELRPGMPGYRMHLPEKIHPYSAGAKGGILGGIVMTIPALIYGVNSGHGIWYPINLLAGMAMPLPNDVHQLEQFNATWLTVATVIHAVTSVSLGLIYGVLLPMLPGWPIVWGGIVAPLLWTGAIYGFMGILNPVLKNVVDWPTFILAQFVYGVTTGLVIVFTRMVPAPTIAREPVPRIGARGEGRGATGE